MFACALKYDKNVIRVLWLISVKETSSLFQGGAVRSILCY